LPAQWVSDGGPGRKRAFGAARHLAVLAQERSQAGGLAHQTPVAANWQAPAGLLDPEGNGEAASYDVHDSGGPVLERVMNLRHLAHLENRRRRTNLRPISG